MNRNKLDRFHRNQRGASDLAIVVLLVVMAGFIAVSMFTNWKSASRRQAGIEAEQLRREDAQKAKELQYRLKRLEEVRTSQRFK